MTIIVPIALPDDIEAKLRERLGRDHLELSEFTMQAIIEKLQRDPASPASERTAFDVWQECFTGETSGRSDVADRDEEVLRAKFDAKRRSGQ